MEIRMKYVVDTNIFNKLVDGKLLPNDLPSDREFIATHLQIDEINNIKDKNKERRAQLSIMFATIAPTLVPTESFFIGVSRIGQGKLGDGDSFEAIKKDLDTLNSKKPNNVQDALIAEVAYVNNFTLLTSDYHLAEIAKKHRINCIYYKTK